MVTPKFTRAIAYTAFLTLLQFIGLVEAGKNSPKNLFVGAIAKASANNLQEYVPPSGRDRIQRTEGAGSRGCPNASFGSVSLLIPNDHVGLTVSARPTFSWYVSVVPSTEMRFALVEPGISKPILVKQFQVKKSGILQFELPPEMPELSVGKMYRWTVSLVCNSNRPSQNIYVRSWIKRVSNIADESQATTILDRNSPAQTLRDRAAVYAHSGIWYDAVAAISKAYLAYPEDSLNAQYLRLLLEQVGLLQVPIPDLQPLTQQPAKNSNPWLIAKVH